MNNTPNKYNNISVDIDRLFEIEPKAIRLKPRRKIYRLVVRYSSAILIKLGLYEVLVEIGFIRKWFLDFKEYWYNCLNGRPLYLHDFYYLLGSYRSKFASVETPDHATNEEFLESWQSSETVYMLFGAVRRFSRTPLISRQFEKYIRNNDAVLEYGCGIAPITTSLLKVGKKRNLDLTIADIRQLNFHYAKYNLSSLVKSFEIVPNSVEDLPQKYNVIIMITVMEHLPNPLETIRNITKFLEPGGILFFDYHADDGDGQDTIEAIEQKKDVLDYISNNYSIIKGSIDYENTMGITVVKKN
ncbi:MAG: hypothetical protein CL712_03135 [Chloroflexi bacterium]|nr:hypothetical protein [Chloroflexota bacterium]|tara:strand:+ start:2443 stop:3342 length:900 start_codon:yes stop_codon:yes gene_type:complete